MRNNLSEQSIKQTIKEGLAPVKKIFERHIVRSETKDSAVAYFRGLISSVGRKNSWQLSEEIGYSNPYAFQYLLGRALWDSNHLRDEVCTYTVNHLGKDGMLSLDETGF